MASSIPVVRQIAWLSLVPQLILLVGAIALLQVAEVENAALWGAAGYLALSLALRFAVARDHRRGIALYKKERFASALPCFERSYAFFSRHTWVDRWRFVTLLSSSRISYREMALLNIAFCQAQLGATEDAVQTYERARTAFPGSKIAEMSLRMLRPESHDA